MMRLGLTEQLPRYQLVQELDRKIRQLLADGNHRTTDEIAEELGYESKAVEYVLFIYQNWVDGYAHSDAGWSLSPELDWTSGEASKFPIPCRANSRIMRLRAPLNDHSYLSQNLPSGSLELRLGHHALYDRLLQSTTGQPDLRLRILKNELRGGAFWYRGPYEGTPHDYFVTLNGWGLPTLRTGEGGKSFFVRSVLRPGPGGNGGTKLLWKAKAIGIPIHGEFSIVSERGEETQEPLPFGAFCAMCLEPLDDWGSRCSNGCRPIEADLKFEVQHDGSISAKGSRRGISVVVSEKLVARAEREATRRGKSTAPMNLILLQTCDRCRGNSSVCFNHRIKWFYFKCVNCGYSYAQRMNDKKWLEKFHSATATDRARTIWG